MRRPLLAAAGLALSLLPAFALHAQPEHDAVLLPFLKAGYREGQSLVREDPRLGMVHALVLEEGEGVAKHRTQLFVFATRGDQRTLIHQAEYAWAALDRLADVDGDGQIDLVLRAGDGGNCWTCGWVEAVTLSPGHVVPLLEPGKFQHLEDVDGDGTLEAIAVDSRWEFFEGVCHACSPRVERIFKRTGATWTDASAAFPAYYRRTVETLRLELDRQVKDNPNDWDEYQFGAVASLLLNRLALGETEGAWRSFDDRITEWRARLEKTDTDGLARLDALAAAMKRLAK